jgi:hypothetical protein
MLIQLKKGVFFNPDLIAYIATGYQGYIWESRDWKDAHDIKIVDIYRMNQSNEYYQVDDSIRVFLSQLADRYAVCEGLMINPETITGIESGDYSTYPRIWFGNAYIYLSPAGKQDRGEIIFDQLKKMKII